MLDSQEHSTQASDSLMNHSEFSNQFFKMVQIPEQCEQVAKVSEKDTKSEQVTECPEQQDANIPYYNLYSFWMPLSDLPKLPDGWRVYRSNSRKNRVFFQNPILDEKTWECPFQESQLIKLFHHNDPRLEHVLSLNHDKETRTQQNSNNTKIPVKQDDHNQPTTFFQNATSNINVFNVVSQPQININVSEKSNESQLNNVYKLPCELPKIEQRYNIENSGDGKVLEEIAKSEIGNKTERDIAIPIFKDTYEQDTGMDDIAPMDWEEVNGGTEQLEEEKMETSQAWFIVCDTNVILEEPAFLNILKRLYSEDYGESRVVVPWIVFGELDNLKRKPDVGKMAVVALRYLRNILEKEDPRLIGQTFMDHQSLSVPHNAVNDDYILSTCVQISNSEMVTMVTNDVNLAVKAKVHKIDVKTGKEMKSYIKNKCKHVGDKEEFNGLIKESNQPTKSAKFDDEKQLSAEDENMIMKILLPELKEHLRRFVSMVVAQGMRNTFNNIWQSRCIRRPPWKLDDCLLCLNQHWVSIADNMDVPKIKELRYFFNRHRTGARLGTSEIRKALYLCLRLINSLPMEYRKFVDEFKCYFRDFQRKVNFVLQKEVQNYYKDPSKSEDGDEQVITPS